jgi:hypothetical protein
MIMILDPVINDAHPSALKYNSLNITRQFLFISINI